MSDRRPDNSDPGVLVDLACARAWPREELLERARAHPTSCSLAGEAVESGFGLVDYDGRLIVLELAATTAVVRHLLDADVETGLRILVRSEPQDGQVTTVDVARAGPHAGAAGHHIHP